MTKFEMNGLESIEAERLDNEFGDIRLTLKGEDNTTVVVYCGRFCDDAETLKAQLTKVAEQVTSDILKGWEDRPDGDNDGFVFPADRYRGYVVQLSGSPWDGEILEAWNGRSHRQTTFPTMDIATYELAAAMASEGCFPNCWYENERGYAEDIGESVLKYADEGGDGLAPLPGVRFENGAHVLTPEKYSAYVVKDYGDMGIVYVLSGDDERRFEEHNTDFAPMSDEEVTCPTCGSWTTEGELVQGPDEAIATCPLCTIQ